MALRIKNCMRMPVMSKSVMTPSRMGRTAITPSVVRPSMIFASSPTARTLRSLVESTTTMVGSLMTMPL